MKKFLSVLVLIIFAAVGYVLFVIFSRPTYNGWLRIEDDSKGGLYYERTTSKQVQVALDVKLEKDATGPIKLLVMGKDFTLDGVSPSIEKISKSNVKNKDRQKDIEDWSYAIVNAEIKKDILGSRAYVEFKINGPEDVNTEIQLKVLGDGMQTNNKAYYVYIGKENNYGLLDSAKDINFMPESYS